MKILDNIDWQKQIRRFIFVFVAAVIVIAVWLSLSNINKGVYGKSETTLGKVLIDVSISDTLTRGMDDKLNRVLQDLLQLKQDSVAVEVKKIHQVQ